MRKMGVKLKSHPDIRNIIKEHEYEITKFCRDNDIEEISLFGSVLTEDFDEESDIDILVKFESNKKPGYFDLIRLEEELSTIFEDREVDLRTPEDLSRYFRDDVLNDSEVIYAQG